MAIHMEGTTLTRTTVIDVVGPLFDAQREVSKGELVAAATAAGAIEVVALLEAPARRRDLGPTTALGQPAGASG